MTTSKHPKPRLDNRRTMRLEQEVWDKFKTLCSRKDLTANEAMEWLLDNCGVDFRKTRPFDE